MIKSNNKIYFEFTIYFPCDEPHSTVSLTQNCKCNHLDGTQTLICGKSLYPKFANAQTTGLIPFLQWTNLLPRMGSHKKKGKMDTSPWMLQAGNGLQSFIWSLCFIFFTYRIAAFIIAASLELDCVDNDQTRGFMLTVGVCAAAWSILV